MIPMPLTSRLARGGSALLVALVLVATAAPARSASEEEVAEAAAGGAGGRRRPRRRPDRRQRGGRRLQRPEHAVPGADLRHRADAQIASTPTRRRSGTCGRASASTPWRRTCRGARAALLGGFQVSDQAQQALVVRQVLARAVEEQAASLDTLESITAGDGPPRGGARGRDRARRRPAARGRGGGGPHVRVAGRARCRTGVGQPEPVRRRSRPGRTAAPGGGGAPGAPGRGGAAGGDPRRPAGAGGRGARRGDPRLHLPRGRLLGVRGLLGSAAGRRGAGSTWAPT